MWAVIRKIDEVCVALLPSGFLGHTRMNELNEEAGEEAFECRPVLRGEVVVL